VSTPEEAADAAIRAQIAEQAASLSTPGEAPDLSAAVPAEADTAALLRRMEELEAAQRAAAALANPPPPEADDTLHLDGNAPGYMIELVATIERRFRKLEGR
jgi:hypothetical protein